MTANLVCSTESPANRLQRDPGQRTIYARLALAHLPRLFTSLDRDPSRATHGCFDRQFWHYRTAAFASEMYQEAVWPLALAVSTPMPDNPWYASAVVRDWVAAGIDFARRNSHRDGSCDDYYPFERALGAAVFSLTACAGACELLDLSTPDRLAWLVRRAHWIARHGETGRLANHHALAAVGLARVARLTGDSRWQQAADARVRQLLDWQHAEGWFEEYGGADPGYQTVTIDCLEVLRRDWQATWLDEPLARARKFVRHFLHADSTLGGHYGSRGTCHFYPHGFELSAAHCTFASDLADGFLRAAAGGRLAALDDDRLGTHRLGSLIQAYRDWSPTRPAAPDFVATGSPRGNPPATRITHFPGAGLWTAHTSDGETIVSLARGGVWRHATTDGNVALDSGWVVEFEDGRRWYSAWHDRRRPAQINAHQQDFPGDHGNLASSRAVEPGDLPRPVVRLRSAGDLVRCRHETASVIKQAALHLGMLCCGRWARNLVRRTLQWRLISRRRTGPIHLDRVLQWCPGSADDSPRLTVTDVLTLRDRRAQVRRLWLAPETEDAYVAAGQVYQPAALVPWTSFEDRVAEINASRCLTVVRHHA